MSVMLLMLKIVYGQSTVIDNELVTNGRDLFIGDVFKNPVNIIKTMKNNIGDGIGNKVQSISHIVTNHMARTRRNIYDYPFNGDQSLGIIDTADMLKTGLLDRLDGILSDKLRPGFIERFVENVGGRSDQLINDILKMVFSETPISDEQLVDLINLSIDPYVTNLVEDETVYGWSQDVADKLINCDKPFVTAMYDKHINIDVILPTDALAGDTVSFMIVLPDGTVSQTNKTLSSTDIESGKTSVTLEYPMPGIYKIWSSLNNRDSDEIEVIVPGVDVPDNADGYISFVEMSDGLKINVTLAESAQIGDEIVLSIEKPDGSVELVKAIVTAEDIEERAVHLTVPPYAADGNYIIRGKVGEEDYGNLSIEFEGLPDLVLTVPDVSDGKIQSAVNIDGIEVILDMPTGYRVGDLAVLTAYGPNGEVVVVNYALTKEDLDAGRVSMILPLLVTGHHVVQTKISDGDFSNVVGFEIELSQLDSFGITSAASDGYLNSEEYLSRADGNSLEHDSFVVTVDIAEGVDEGDVLAVTLDRPDGEPMEVLVTVTDADVTNGSIDVRFSDIGGNGQYNLSASYSRNGDELKKTEDSPFIMDIQTPGDTINDGISDVLPLVSIPEADDTYINWAEMLDGVQTSVHLPAGTQLDDTVTLIIKDSDGNVVDIVAVVSREDLGRMEVQLDIMDLDDGEYTVEAVITDAAGNSSGISSPKMMVLDTKPPGDTDGDGIVDKQSILTMPQADDGIVNVEEEADLKITVTVPDDTVVGDKMQVTISDGLGYTKFIDHVATANDIADGKVDLLTTDLGSPGEYSVTSIIEDAAGNTSQPSGPIVFQYDDRVPGDLDGDGVSDLNPTLQIGEADDHYINYTENKDGVETRVLLPEELIGSLNPGDVVSLNVEGPNSVIKEQILQQSDLDNGYVDVLLDPLTEDGHYKVKATIYDEANQSTGSSLPVAFDYDGTVPGDSNNDGEPDTDPEIMLEALNDDNYVNGMENQDYVDGTVVLPPGTQEGDTINIKLINRVTGVTEITQITVVDGPVGDSTLNQPVRLPSFTMDGPYDISVQIEDPAGNVSNESVQKRFQVDMTTPGDQSGDGISDMHSIVVVPEADDFYINGIELSDGVDARVDIPVGTQVGDTILLSVHHDGGVESVEYQVTDSDVAAGKANIPIEAMITEEREYTISSRIYDDAGNSSLVSSGDLFSTLVDTTAPTTGLTIERIEVNSGTVNGFGTSSSMADVIVSDDGTLESTDKVQGSIDGGVTWQDMVLNDAGDWEYRRVVGGRSPSTINFVTHVVDIAGNPTQSVEQDIFFDDYVPVIDEPSKSHTIEEEQVGPMNTDTTRADTGIEYSLTAGDNLFSIDPSTGVVNFKNAPVFDSTASNQYTYTVKAITQGGNEVEEVVTVDVTEKNLAPTDIQFGDGYDWYSHNSDALTDQAIYVVKTNPHTGNSIELYYNDGSVYANWYDSNHVLMEDISPVTIASQSSSIVGITPNSVDFRADGHYVVMLMYRSDESTPQHGADSRIRNHPYVFNGDNVFQWSASPFITHNVSAGWGNAFFTEGGDVMATTESMGGTTVDDKQYRLMDGNTGAFKYGNKKVPAGDKERFSETFPMGDKFVFIGYNGRDSPLVMETFNISDGTRYGSNPQYSYGNSPDGYHGTGSYTAYKIDDSNIATLFLEGEAPNMTFKYKVCDIDGTCATGITIDPQTQEAIYPQLEYDDNGNLVIVFLDNTDNKIYTMTVSPTGTIIKNRTTIGEPIPSGNTGEQLCLTKLDTGEYKLSLFLDPSLDIVHYIFNSGTPGYSYMHFPKLPQVLGPLTNITDPNTESYNLNHTVEVISSAPDDIISYDDTTKVFTAHSNPPYQDIPYSLTIRVTDEPGLYYDKVVNWPPYWSE